MHDIRLIFNKALRPEPPDVLEKSHSGPSDFALNPGSERPKKRKPAAVLVPVIARQSGPTILLTQRTSHLRHHAGQISFPGGRADETDESAAHTALRESAEEIGLDAKHVEIEGYLDRYLTGTGYAIAPTVGWIDHLPDLTLNDDEVAHVFEMPISFILDPLNRQERSVLWGGQIRKYYVYDYEHRYIWGATAGMLSNLAGLLSVHLPETTLDMIG